MCLSYPGGSFDFRPMQVQEIKEAISPRYYSLKRLIETFPRRKLVLVGDTTPTSAVAAYVRIAREYPEQVQCLIIRDVGATDSANWMMPNMKALRSLKGRYVVFATPGDLRGTEDVMRHIHANATQHRQTMVRCGGLDIDTRRSHEGRSAILQSLFRGFALWLRCNAFPWRQRPSPSCPFDRRYFEQNPFRVPREGQHRED